MIIANPIYDVVFKRLMENERVAKFFIGTMLGQKVHSLELKPQEFTYTDKLAGLAVFRLDFVAVIKTEEGAIKKILIEIQKAKNRIDLMRFRNYLAEQYKKQDTVEEEKITLPITTIYILGFPLLNVETACVGVERQYRDMINDKVLETKNDFIEQLTHDSYIVQVKRITGRYKSRLDKLLSVFEQSNFIDDTETIKEYHYPVENDEEMKKVMDILHHSGIDPETRKAIEAEREAWRSVNAMFEEEKRAFEKKLQEKEVELLEKNEVITEHEKVITEHEKVITEKEQVLEAQRKLIEELQKKLKDK